MADRFSFEIVTLAGLQFQADVYQVQIPTREGYVGILPHHTALMTIVTPGDILIQRHPQATKEQTEIMPTTGGFIDVQGRRVRLLANDI